MAGVLTQMPKHPSNLQTYKLRMAANENSQSSLSVIYDVRSDPAGCIPASSWREAVEDHRKCIEKEYRLYKDERAEAWRISSWENVITESRMIEGFENGKQDALYAMDNDGLSTFRVLF